MLSDIKKLILNRRGALDKPAVDYMGEDANRLLTQALSVDGDPVMIARFGAVELRAAVLINTPLNWHNLSRLMRGEISSVGLKNTDYSDLCHNAGFFPYDRALIRRYADMLISDAAECDILGSWLPGEKQLPSITDKLHYTSIRRIDLEPYYYEHPYTLALEGQKVLVVHPYEDSILRQWPLRHSLFGNRQVWPECRLTVLKAVQSIAGNKPPYDTWFDALDDMKRRMDAIDYDVALIGCGAYGFHLAAHAKRTGHKAVHLGGVLQMLFGIIGGRWDGQFDFVDEKWIRPLPSDRPAGAETIENGCYW